MIPCKMFTKLKKRYKKRSFGPPLIEHYFQILVYQLNTLVEDAVCKRK